MKWRRPSIHPVAAQQHPADYKEKLANFPSYCSKKMLSRRFESFALPLPASLGFHLPNVLLTSSLTFDFPVNHNVEKKATSTVNSPFTVVLGCLGNGHKMARAKSRARIDKKKIMWAHCSILQWSTTKRGGGHTVLIFEMCLCLIAITSTGCKKVDALFCRADVYGCAADRQKSIHHKWRWLLVTNLKDTL